MSCAAGNSLPCVQPGLQATHTQAVKAKPLRGRYASLDSIKHKPTRHSSSSSASLSNHHTYSLDSLLQAKWHP